MSTQFLRVLFLYILLSGLVGLFWVLILFYFNLKILKDENRVLHLTLLSAEATKGLLVDYSFGLSKMGKETSVFSFSMLYSMGIKGHKTKYI